MIDKLPFLYGTQYYRAPTPAPECWKHDFRQMREVGLNAVKFWVQWRWSHRGPDDFYFEDIAALMDLASEHDMAVTLNVILDTAPDWLFEKYPDAHQMDARGAIVPSQTVSCRQIGGVPGPCYRHKAATEEKLRFLRATVCHFREHPALHMWDIWNEPELCLPRRTPDLDTLVCYCPSCENQFHDWLRAKYSDIDRLNMVWGRCYQSWDHVELPRHSGTIQDFIDWRIFQSQSLVEDARRRVDLVKSLDLRHACYLHIVPNNWFPSVTCADGPSMADGCDCFGGSVPGGAIASALHVMSAAQGRICYNAECHINFGSTNLHQPFVDLQSLIRELIPQLGLGFRGFLYWQYRPETLGQESPAWGLVNPDGSGRTVTHAVETFGKTILPHADDLMRGRRSEPQVAVWRGVSNEVFEYCISGTVEAFNLAIGQWITFLYEKSIPFDLLSSDQLVRLESGAFRVLVLPSPYYLYQQEADAIRRWVEQGGILVTEAHLMGYDGTTGRHSTTVPGGELASHFGLHEAVSTSPRLLHDSAMSVQDANGEPADVQTALTSRGQSGSNYYSIRLKDGRLATGARRYAELKGDSLVSLAGREDRDPCIGYTDVGSGRVYYAGTNLGEAAVVDRTALDYVLDHALSFAGVEPTVTIRSGSGPVHVDPIFVDTSLVFLAVNNLSNESSSIQIDTCEGATFSGLFSGHVIETGTVCRIPGGLVDLFVRET